MSSISILGIIKKAKYENYKIVILFFYLKNYNITIQRVKIRVKAGGHSIPVDVIKRRYRKGLINLMNKFVDNCDYCSIVDNSMPAPKVIAEIKNNSKQLLIIHSDSEWKQIKKYERKEN